MKKLMEDVLSQVTSARAEGDLYFAGGKSLQLSAQKGELSTYKVSSSKVLGLRVIKDGKVGVSYTESLDRGSLSLMVRQALENAENSGPNLHERLLDLSGEVNDRAHYEEGPVDIAEKTARVLELESKVLALEPRATAVPYNGYSESEYESFYLSTKGRATSYSDKSYSVTTSALLDENGKKAIFYDSDIAHTFAELRWEKVIETSLLYARDILGERALPTGKYEVMFDEDNLKSLVECFSNFYSAKAAMDKVNPWAEKLGEVLVSKEITIIDDPLHQGAFRATRFDGEGVVARPLTLIEDGCLKSFLHNSITASYFGTETTGHAYRGASGPLGVSGTHFLIRGKNAKPMPKRYLEIIQIDGLHSGANRVTGNFSFAVKGHLWENGEKVMTFGNVTLSGNMIELLNNVEVVGTELRASYDRSFFSVPLIFSGLSIAGS